MWITHTSVLNLKTPKIKNFDTVLLGILNYLFYF